MEKMLLKFSDVDVATDGAVRMNLWQGVTGEEKKQLAEIFAKQVRGRILAFKEGDEALAFEPYREGVSAPMVQLKEKVGEVTVTRTPKLMKLSLSLPLTMSRNMMQLMVMEQSTLLGKALGEGLYERMVG